MELPVLDCRSCGACCTDIGLPPYKGHELVGSAGIPEDLRQSLLAEFAAWRAEKGNPRGRPCSRYDPATRSCTIYRWRPAVCRDLEVGGHLCNHYRARPPK